MEITNIQPFFSKKTIIKSIGIFLILITCNLVSFSQNYDGNCPSGETSYTDCDCAPDGMTNFQAVDIKDIGDYANVVYIDPTANDQNENGSFDHPYNSWYDISWVSNTAYVQKRGTTFSSNATIYTGASDIMLGAYGTGDKPIIIGTSSYYTLNVESTYVLLRDISFQAPNVSGNNGVLFLRGNSNYATVYECDIYNSGWQGIMAYSDYGHIIGCHIYNIMGDAIWVAGTPYFEIAYNNIHDFNQLWFPGAREEDAPGDGIQMAFDFQQVWIHHNIIDHGTAGNKATILMNSLIDVLHPEWHQCTRAVIEFNELTSPKVTFTNGATINLHRGSNYAIRYNKLYAAEVIEGSYPDSLSQGIYVFSTNDSIYGNVFVGFNRAISISSGSVLVANNTFYDTQDFIIESTSAHINAFNNIFDQNLFTGITVDSEADNMFVSGTPWANSFSGDPDYVNAGNNDFRLLSTSDAIDEGTSLSFYKYDMEMNEISGTVDVGANEYSGATPNPPSAPTNLHVTDSTNITITIAWTDVTNETQYIIERSTGGGFTQIATVNANVTSYTNTGLTANTAYSYRVKATNSGGDSGYSSELLAHTANDPVNIALNKPAAATSIEGIDYIADKAFDGNATTTRWASAETDNESICVDLEGSYQLSKVILKWETAYGLAYSIDVSSDSSNWTPLFQTTNGDGGTDDINVTGSGRYVRMNGTDRGTQWGFSIFEFEVYGTEIISPPSSPSALHVIDSTNTTITIGWTDGSDNEDGFIIERSLSSGTEFASIDTVSENSYTDTGLTSATTYYYQVKATNSFGDSGYSNELEAHTDNDEIVTTNVALNKSATQVSTSYGGVASRAVDGNTSGLWANESISHTGGATNAWWEVDLGLDYQIDSIEVWNRIDGCCISRMDNYYVLVSDTFTTTNLATTLAQGGVWSEHRTSYPNPAHYFTPNTTGHYVRVQLGDYDELNIAEVIVWGYEAGLSRARLSEKLNPEQQEENSLMVYPNPGSTMITISGFDKAIELKIVDILGKVVYQKGYAVKNTQVDISNLKKGLYLIMLKTENNYHLKKFIKN